MLNNRHIPEKYKDLPLAVCCVIRNENGKLLLVSRKDDPTNFGLPGGKVDPGETLDDAIVREVIEETGLTITPGPVIYKKMCPRHAPEGKDYYAFAFVAKSYEGEITTQECGVVKWGSWADQQAGSFADYNSGVRSSLNAYDWLVEGKRYLIEEKTGLGLALLSSLRDKVSNAKELSEKLGSSLEQVTNALLNLSNSYLVSGFEGSYYRTTLKGKDLLDVDL